jgi:hypothetical protein
MACYVHLATSPISHSLTKGQPGFLVDDTPEYWFLYPYFETANMDTSTDLIDLYGGRQINKDQLIRLERELLRALSEINSCDEALLALVSWSGDRNAAVMGRWEIVKRDNLINLINSFLSIIADSKATGLSVVLSGD